MRYAIDERLGGGGMAEVFRARAPDGREVAIKRVLEGLDDPKFATMFAEEARLSAQLSHPNVIAILDEGRDDLGRPYLVMELVDGPTLDRLIDAGSLPISVAVHITIEVLRGLGYVHDFTGDGLRGLVHRDVSPHNVLLSWRGDVKVSDFGVAKARAATMATASELVKGKPAYMSPEQANAQPLDGRSDLFAVGVMLWEMLAGRPLFSGATTQELFARLLFAPLVPPSTHRAEISPALDRITMRLLARERAERYPDAASAIAELVACMPPDPTALVALLDARFPSHARSTSTHVPTAGGRAAHAAALTGERRRRAPLLVGLGLVAIAAIAVAFVMSTRPASVTRRDAMPAPDAAVIVLAPDAPADAMTVYDHETITPRGFGAMLEALHERCPWPTTMTLVGIREYLPDGTLAPPIVMIRRGGGIDAPRTPAPKDLADCVREFMSHVRSPKPDPGITRTDEDYGQGILE